MFNFAIRNPRSGFKAQTVADWEKTITAKCDKAGADEDLFAASTLEEWIDEALAALEQTELNDFRLKVEEGKYAV